MQVLDKTYQRPAFNKNHIRLYTHHLCPFVERARLVLAAKHLQYQMIEVSLERRAKWHYLLNEGFLPILDVPHNGGHTILESRIIMDYLENAYSQRGESKLYSDCPEKRAQQHMVMKVFDDLASVIFTAIMSHGTSKDAITKLEKVLAKLEQILSQSKTKYFLNFESYSMVDLYGFPHAARIFYLKDSASHIMNECIFLQLQNFYCSYSMYEEIKCEEKYPLLKQWVSTIRGRPELNDGRGITDVRYFHAWLKELQTVPVGTKPPLRYPLYKL